MKTSKLYVIKRGGLQFLVAMTVLNIFISDGRQEEVHFDKITSRIQKLCYNLNMDFVDPVSLFLLFKGAHHTGCTRT